MIIDKLGYLCDEQAVDTSSGAIGTAVTVSDNIASVDGAPIVFCFEVTTTFSLDKDVSFSIRGNLADGTGDDQYLARTPDISKTAAAGTKYYMALVPGDYEVFYVYQDTSSVTVTAGKYSVYQVADIQTNLGTFPS